MEDQNQPPTTPFMGDNYGQPAANPPQDPNNPGTIVINQQTPALILHSGGTTGTPKGIVLSNGNMNTQSIQATIALPDLDSNDVILGIMPIFHGFGLSVSITDAFTVGAKVVLIPQFNAKEFDKLIKKVKEKTFAGREFEIKIAK